jgi:predicted DCC family thiol-disulfide oxidoreductase YuxK
MSKKIGSKTKPILIYDASCPFCSGLARRLQRHIGIRITPNHRCKIKGIQAAIRRDVHLVVPAGRGMMVYSGAAAAAKVLSLKYNFIWTIYNIPPCRVAFKALYFILKKSRKYLWIDMTI